MSSSRPKKFNVLPSSCVDSLVDHLKLNRLDAETSAALTEDASFIIRTIIYEAKYNMRLCRRTHMKASDVTKALQFRDKAPMLGVTPKLDFVSVKGFLVSPSPVVDLKKKLSECLNQTIYECRTLPMTLTSCWHDVNSVPVADEKLVKRVDKDEIEETNHEYYETVVECLLGDDKKLFAKVLEDLRTNPRVSSVLPCFVTLFSKGGAISHDLKKLSNLLFTMKAILDNPHVSPLRFLKAMLYGVLLCVDRPHAASINAPNDHWILRDYGAFVAANIVFRCPSHTYGLLQIVKSNVTSTLNDHDKPLCSHYGSLVLLSFMETDTIINLLLPLLINYLNTFLSPILDAKEKVEANLKNDARRVMSGVFLCIRQLFRNSDIIDKLDDDLKSKVRQFDFWDLFGDSFIAVIPPPVTPPLDRPSKPHCVSPAQFLHRRNNPNIRTSYHHDNIAEIFDVEDKCSSRLLSKHITINYGKPRVLKSRKKCFLSTNGNVETEKGKFDRRKVSKPVFDNHATLLSWI